MPEVVITFEDAAVIGDVSFHPCVRVDRWERERVVAFVPLDGTSFELMRFRAAKHATARLVSAPFAPVYCNLLVTTAPPPPATPEAGSGQPPGAATTLTGRLEIVVGARPSAGASSPAEDVCVRLPLPPKARFLEAKAGDGTVSFNDRTCVWRIGTVALGGPAARLTGSFHLPADQATASVTALLEFSVPAKPLSGLKIQSLQIPNQPYAFYKGVKSIVKAGEFQVRTAAVR